MSLGKRFGFIGGGVMAEAILRALLQADFVDRDEVTISEPLAPRRQALATLGVEVARTNQEAATGADVLLLAVKPGVVPAVLAEFGQELQPTQLVISIAAGVPLARIEELLPDGVPAVRVMPNTPVQVAAGAAALARGRHATEEHAQLALQLFNAAGRCVEVPESLLDAVTGLSGSGPAYVCMVVEALADGGVKAGLPRDVALTLAAQTVLGAAQLILETGDHPAVWKDRVATPGGTTIAGIAALEAAGLRSALIQAVEAAARRARELSGH